MTEKNIHEPPPPSYEIHPIYSLTDIASNSHLDIDELSQWVAAIQRKKQAILYGPPGTGKTFMAHQIAQHLVGGGDGFIELVQFHPAYAYEDFIQGIRPHSQPDGTLHYQLQPGRFLTFCAQAQQRNGPCILIIDEINRANLAAVFGELMYLLEYRQQAIPLASGGYFHIPNHVHLIGTMNTADRSLALVDHALRRRFAFIHLAPNYHILQQHHTQTNFPINALITLLNRLNQQIGDPHYHIGHSFFIQPNLSQHLPLIWRMEIEPYLEEFFFDQPERIDAFRWANIATQLQ